MRDTKSACNDIVTNIGRIIPCIALAMLFSGCPSSGANQAEENMPAPPPPKKITVIFGGDVMQHQPQISAAKRDSVYDYSDTFMFLKPVFDSADIVILNFETTVSSDGRYSGYPLFASPAELVGALKKAGADALMLANNHIGDKGMKGIRATTKAIGQAGMKYTGAFADSTAYEEHNPLYLEAKGIGLAILNYTYGTNGMPVPEGSVVNVIDTVRIAADLEKIDRDKADHTIVFFHWGNEYSRKPSHYQKRLAEWCHERGAAFVIGSHPHVIQPVEVRRDNNGMATGVTAYSLGNLVSNQRWRYSDGGMLLKVTITHRDSMPAEIEAGYMLAWVHTPYVDGRKRYRILPEAVADMLLLNDPAAKYNYDIFISDSRRLLSADSSLLEIR